MNEQPTRICILGGGFGGLYTALRLNELPWERSQRPEITLIDRSDRFLFSPLLYELVSGEMQTWEVAPPFAELLEGTAIKFCHACATEIDLEGKQILLEGGTTLPYDKLVLSVGGKTPLDVPGAKDYALPFRTLEDAYRLQARLRDLEASERDKIRIAIVGGSYSGVELACKLADRLGERGRIRIIERCPDILTNAVEFNRKSAKTALEARQIWLDLETDVQSIDSDAIALLYKGQVDIIPADIVLWTVGTTATPLLETLPLKRETQGRVVIAPTLQVLDCDGVFALGDLADCRDAVGQKVPATGQSAIQQADYCAWNLWASLTGRPLLPFRYQPLGEMMTLGIESATVSGMGIKLDGSLGYLTRRLAYLYRLPTLKHQLAVGLNWITQPLAELLSQ
ncbi:NAD(P)/FAD-dependent oxidoreductase [Oscillatoria sp. FACHB-1406]|uniref:NAD(P)/FAD-dependent oxidoreductase n=1 Tax=Oscillatoria sp. FACHB-1406 TaxID=2692846 RepID=UPI001684D79F|nr:NAD(P)/FAD-dependent oxidoreductase [Oscillatoria sp. FACHB-1406]MBD2577419.1 NAD(P)/FAD-dependent oxidoreductase [Oscillatoria sp. FACHB-1406]